MQQAVNQQANPAATQAPVTLQTSSPAADPKAFPATPTATKSAAVPLPSKQVGQPAAHQLPVASPARSVNPGPAQPSLLATDQVTAKGAPSVPPTTAVLQPPPAKPAASNPNDALTTLLATVLAQASLQGNAPNDQTQALLQTLTQVLNAASTAAPAMAGTAPVPSLPEPTEVAPPGAPSPAAAPAAPPAATAAPAATVAPPAMVASTLACPKAVDRTMRANSSSHPNEYRTFQRFCEHSAQATELRKAWLSGGQTRLSMFSKFLASNCDLNVHSNHIWSIMSEILKRITSEVS